MSPKDLTEAFRTVHTLKFQKMNAPYFLIGKDLEGHDLGIAFDLSDEIIIVTVITEEMMKEI